MDEDEDEDEDEEGGARIIYMHIDIAIDSDSCLVPSPIHASPVTRKHKLALQNMSCSDPSLHENEVLLYTV